MKDYIVLELLASRSHSSLDVTLYSLSARYPARMRTPIKFCVSHRLECPVHAWEREPKRRLRHRSCVDSPPAQLSPRSFTSTRLTRARAQHRVVVSVMSQSHRREEALRFTCPLTYTGEKAGDIQGRRRRGRIEYSGRASMFISIFVHCTYCTYTLCVTTCISRGERTVTRMMTVCFVSFRPPTRLLMNHQARHAKTG